MHMLHHIRCSLFPSSIISNCFALLCTLLYGILLHYAILIYIVFCGIIFYHFVNDSKLCVLLCHVGIPSRNCPLS